MPTQKIKFLTPAFLLVIGLGSAIAVVGFYFLLDWLTYNFRVPFGIFFILQFVPEVLLFVSVTATLVGIGMWAWHATVRKLAATGTVLLLSAFALSEVGEGPNIHGPFAPLLVFFAVAVLVGGLVIVSAAIRLIVSRVQNSDANAKGCNP